MPKNAASPATSLLAAITTRLFDGRVATFHRSSGLQEWRTFDNDGRITGYGVTAGPTDTLNLQLDYGDGINLTSVTDALDATKSESYGYSAANRLANASGPWGRSATAMTAWATG